MSWVSGALSSSEKSLSPPGPLGAALWRTPAAADIIVERPPSYNWRSSFPLRWEMGNSFVSFTLFDVKIPNQIPCWDYTNESPDLIWIINGTDTLDNWMLLFTHFEIKKSQHVLWSYSSRIAYSKISGSSPFHFTQWPARTALASLGQIIIQLPPPSIYIFQDFAVVSA